MPELTVALDRDRQVIVQLAFRLSGPKAEKRVKAYWPRLRHALVLRLSDQPAGALSPELMGSVVEEFRHEANQILERKSAVRSVLLQKFVVQVK